MVNASEQPSEDVQTLKAEIERLNKIIKALIDRAEQDMNTNNSDFSSFQTTVMLEDKVKIRTRELEEALRKNEKITRALQEANRLIEESEQHLKDITSALGEGLLVIDKEAIVKFINVAACRVLGREEKEVLGKNSHDLFHHSYPDGKPIPIECCKNLQVMQTGKPYISEDEYYWRADGSCFPVSIISTPIMYRGVINGVVIAFHDISQSVRERNRLREMQAAIDQSPISVLIFDKDRNIIYANPELIRATGYTKEELQNQNASIFRAEETPGDNFHNLWKTILSGESWSGEILYRRKDGSEFWQSWKIAPILNEHGIIHNFVGVAEDITEKKKLHAFLQEMSYQDGLTRVPNRRAFDEYFSTEWQRARRNAMPLSVIMIDIDFFKRYNDSLGHQSGDQCLKKVAATLKNHLPRAGDLLARYGGEEFVCILPETDINGAQVLAQRLQKAVYELKIPHPDSHISSYITVSMGISSCVPDQSNNGQVSLLKAADIALYQAKNNGRNQYEVYPVDLDKSF